METVEGHLAAAEQALRQGQARKALEEARAGLRLQPDSGRGLALLGLAYVMMGEEADGRSALAHAAEVAPLDSRVRYLYYLALAQLRDIEGARAQLTYFCQLEPENTQAKALLARLGGAVMGLPPLPRPPSSAVWYDSSGHALADAGDLCDDEDETEPPPGPDVVLCPECGLRTWKGWLCKHCGAALPRPTSGAA